MQGAATKDTVFQGDRGKAVDEEEWAGMRILVWSHSTDSQALISPALTSAGHVLFRESMPAGLPSAARREEPYLVVLVPERADEELRAAVLELAGHPDTRWTPILIVAAPEVDRSFLRELLEAGASSLITLYDDEPLLRARLAAMERSVLGIAALRSARLTDEGTGFYHKSFLLDQLEVFCRKRRRDGVDFCLLFTELRGSEEAMHKAAVELAQTVRGADLFGRWEGGLFAVLLPASGLTQAQLLSQRFASILSGHSVEARCGLAVSGQGPVESEAVIESALNALDSAWQADSPLLWTWDEQSGSGVPSPAV